MKQLSVFTLLLFISTVVFSQRKDEAAIRQCFDQYKTAILQDKGNDTASFVDENTIDYYSEVIELVRTADSATVDQLNTLDKMMVLLIRHRSTKEEIGSFTGKSLFIYAVENGMVGKGSVEENSIGTITVEGKTAKAQLVVAGEVVPMYFTFRKQSGTWKLDLTQVIADSLASLNQSIAGMGMTANEFILTILPYSNGQEVRPDIWQPVQ